MKIEVLILTDNEKHWRDRIHNEVNIRKSIRTHCQTRLNSELFDFLIMSSLPYNYKGKRFAAIIIDKPVDQKIYSVLSASGIVKGKVIHTENYYDEMG